MVGIRQGWESEGLNVIEEDMDFNVRRVAVTMRAEEIPFIGVPINAGRGGLEVEGRLREAEFSTTDGMRMTFGFIQWPNGSRDVQPLDYLSGPDEYRRLERAGRMTFNPTVDGLAVSALRVMKYGDRVYASLATVDWAELDRLAGTDAAELLLSHGATRVGSHLELRPSAGRFKDAPALEVAIDGAQAAFTAFALTRVIPIMEAYGRDGVEVLHA